MEVEDNGNSTSPTPETHETIAERVRNRRRRRTDTSTSGSTDDQHEERLSRRRERYQTARTKETTEQREERLSQRKKKHEASQAAETAQQRESRLSQKRERDEATRATETIEQREGRLSHRREREQVIRASVTPEQREIELSRRREQEQTIRAAVTPEQREIELSRRREREQAIRAAVTTDEHADQLRHRRVRRHSSREDIGVALTNSRPEPHYLGPMNKQCCHCMALHFEAEANTNGSYNSCCNHGKIKLPQSSFSGYPQFFKQLLTSTNKDAMEFRNNIRNYNSSIALASMGANMSVLTSRGPYCYKIHGQVYHNVGPLHPEGQTKSYGQLYILDTDIAAKERMSNPANTACNKELMTSLGKYIAENNPYAGAYRMMFEVEEHERTAAASEGREIKPVLMVFKEPTYKDRHRYNVPIANEVALIYVGEEVPELRSVAVHSRCNKLAYLSDIDERCDPMTYPVFYPKGGYGWNINLKKESAQPTRRTRLSQREYYAYLLHVRNEFSPLFYGGKLFQQWIVDSWARTEQNRLHYLRTHQTDLRADTYNTISVHLAGDNPEELIGKKVVLPSTFQSGPRAMQQSYQDAMAIVARFGKPDYFLTFTCSPKWLEVAEQLLPNGQSASDRPDLIARVFELKLQELLNDLKERKVIGEVLAYVYVVEFQKRGLPHCHMLLTMKSAWKPRCATDVDKVISAELPDELTDAKLHSLVSTLMIHRPCGVYNQHQTCMRDGKCTKRYPKPFCEQTQMKTNGYPIYRRPQNSRKILLKEIEVDNQWVVSYNAYFIKKYEAHMNLEVCALIQAVMYLFKYVYKGEDRANIDFKGTDKPVVDEIAHYINARYLCSPEGVHHLFEYKMQGKSHHIERLDLHLPDEQNVQFAIGKEAEALEKRSETKLTAFFKLNTKCEQYFDFGISESRTNLKFDSRNLFYNKIPEYYVWDQKEWKERQRERENTIGRMFTVSPKEIERFSLRIILLSRKGPKSFEDLRTAAGVVQPTFTEAAKEMGVMHDYSYWIQCMDEAKEVQLPAQLRNVFVCLICNSEVHQPIKLWEMFKDYLSEDFVYRGHSQEESYILAYYDIADQAESQSVKLEEKIPAPGPRPLSCFATNIDYAYHEKEGSEMYNSLSVDQKTIVDSILYSINSNQTCLCYVDGPGGSGKTFVYNCLYNILTGHRKKIINVCWSGIAATLLYNGRTVCNAFKLDVKNNCKTSSMKAQTIAAKLLLEADIIIWDEAPMAPKASLEAVDVLLRDRTRKPQEPFGGKIMLLGGDFRQVLPIVEHGSEMDMINASIKNSDLWCKFKQFTLSKNLRLLHPNNNEWARTLITIGNGTYPENDNGEIELDEEMYLKKDDDLIDAVFGNLNDVSIDELANRTILAPKNVNVFEINQEVLNRMNGEEREYQSIDELAATDNADELTQNFPTEYLNSMAPTGLPPHNLKLKKDCLVMVLRNINVLGGLVNGCRLIVREMGKYILHCEFVTGTRKGQKVMIPRIELEYDKGIPFTLKRRQFPVRLCFAMTINKSQGQRFERVGLDLRGQVFAHGQLYVALTRATAKSGIIIQSENRLIRNVVLREALD